jgi:hypothetical protein
MSTLKVTNIQDTGGGNSSTSAEIYSGRAKAWVNFNGTGTVAIRDDFNVSSITDVGSGNYTVNLSNAMPDANYVTNITSSDDNVAATFTYLRGAFGGAGTQTSSAANFYVYGYPGGPGDRTTVQVSFFR